MEPITHVLYGATLGRAGLNRITPLATATVALAAEAPDVDVFVRLFADSVTSFAHHRGITHTFVGAPFVAAAVVGVIYGIQRLARRIGRDHPRGGPFWIRWARARGAPRWGMLYLFANIGILSHILLDYTNGYGVRPLSPFLHEWYARDTVFIVEPVMWAALLLGLIVPGLFALIHDEIGARTRGPRGRGGAIFALVAIAVMWGVRDHYHQRAVVALERETYRGAQPLRVGAYPYPLNPFLWHGIVETEGFFQTMRVDARSSRVHEDALTRIYFKPEETAVLEAAKSSRLGRIYLDWAVFPVTDVDSFSRSQAWQVRFSDLRFRYPTDSDFLYWRRRGSQTQQPRRAPSVLGGYVLLGRDLEVLAETMGSPTREDAYATALDRIRDPDPTTD